MFRSIPGLLASLALVACGGPSIQVKAQSTTAPTPMKDAVPGVIHQDAVEGVGGRAAATARRHRKLVMSASRAERCASVLPLATTIAAAAGVDPMLIMAIAWVESGFDPEARSGAGAVGLMQLMPRTGAAMGCTDREDPTCSLRGGTRLMTILLAKHGQRVVYALCAYNAGSGRIRSAWRQGRQPFNYWYAERVLAARARLTRTGCSQAGPG
jgi:soluble lytic murein transglycosylase-like protein